MANKILTVKAKHFIGASFLGDVFPCALKKAAMDQYKTSRVHERLADITIDGIKYRHEWYGSKEFIADQILADESDSINTVIRKVKLLQLGVL